ncbi:MAG: DUF3800 domain-containing protein [Acetobacteraceae bacterium]
MLVFIDESGDAGFHVERGSTPIFVAAMVIFSDGDAARKTEETIREAAARLRVVPEFKFNNSRDSVRGGFFNAVQDCPFLVRAIVVRKEAIYSPRLKTDKEGFYRFFVRQMLANDNGTLDSAKVVIDGSGDREFQKRLVAALRQRLGSRLSKVHFSNSRSDLLVQLADMCAGAIARSYRKDRTNSSRWRLMLNRHINDVWDFR